MSDEEQFSIPAEIMKLIALGASTSTWGALAQTCTAVNKIQTESTEEYLKNNVETYKLDAEAHDDGLCHCDDDTCQGAPIAYCTGAVSYIDNDRLDVDLANVTIQELTEFAERAHEAEKPTREAMPSSEPPHFIPFTTGGTASSPDGRIKMLTRPPSRCGFYPSKNSGDISDPIDTLVPPYAVAESTKIEGKYHSIQDKPALVTTIGDRLWFKHGELHRTNGPAVETSDSLSYYVDGLKHRGGGLPAIVTTMPGPYCDEWWVAGKRHRDGGQPAVCHHKQGIYEWWVNGKRHRDDGLPAFVDYSRRHYEWWVNGKRHREGGLPAIYCTPSRKMSWWVDDKLHRDGDKPAHIEEFIGEYCWVSDPTAADRVAQLDNIDGTCRIWCVDGEIHRDENAAVVRHCDGVFMGLFYDHGQLESETAVSVEKNGRRKAESLLKNI